MNFFGIFRQSDPPSPQEDSKCKNAQFLQWILKDDDAYFKKIRASYIWMNSFTMKNVGILNNMLPPPYCVTGPRWVNTDYLPSNRAARALFYQHGLTLILAWISNYIHYKLWGEITYPFLNFNGCTVEVLEWISNFIPYILMDVITYPCWD